MAGIAGDGRSRRVRARRAVMIGLALGLVGPVVVPASAGTGVTAASLGIAAAVPASSVRRASPGELIEGQPTEAQVAESLARARALRDRARGQEASVAQAREAVDAAAADSALALEAFAQAERRQAVAVQEQVLAEQRLAEVLALVADRRSELGRWAREVYADGGSLGASPMLYTLFSGGSTDDVASVQQVMAGVGRSRSTAIEALAAAVRSQEAAARQTEQTAARAGAAAEQAREARASRDEALDEQRRRLARAESSLADTRAGADQADRDAAQLARAWGDDGGTGAADNRATGQVGACVGGRTELYPNGRIPAAALCPLVGAPGELLRADAAYGFDRLNVAYTRRFGRSLCITDSYRSYDEQVAVHLRSPGMSARPGTSNHGWGTAVDLCGGIESFGTTQHGWLRQNAALYGWFHPAWAQSTGSLPEAWHWEYAADPAGSG